MKLKRFSVRINSKSQFQRNDLPQALKYIKIRVETKHRITENLAQIARKLTRSTKIEIENARKKIARSLPGSKEDRGFYDRDRSDRNSMLEMLAR